MCGSKICSTWYFTNIKCTKPKMNPVIRLKMLYESKIVDGRSSQVIKIICVDKLTEH
jgi:hypothetical protein